MTPDGPSTDTPPSPGDRSGRDRQARSPEVAARRGANGCPDAPAPVAVRIAAWQGRAGRQGLPWQKTRDPYRIWLSEIMLQQTQARTVIPYYHNFLRRFPEVGALADAPLDAVLQSWAGLGYYARARNLHRCAQVVREAHGGRFPRTAAELATLPGIGRSTAAAIAAFAYGERVPILDGNVRRVLARHAGIDGNPASSATVRALWARAQAILDEAPADLDMSAYTQGQMDLGALVCTRRQPDCARCPLAADCVARRQGRQDEIPAPRPRKPLPQRRALFLIAEHRQRILLRRRPDAGLWGGLWTPPQYDAQVDLERACQQLQPGSTPHPLAAFTHVFTHFRLTLHPWRAQLRDAPAARAAKGQRWVGIDELADYGMPTPIHHLLTGLYAG